MNTTSSVPVNRISPSPARKKQAIVKAYCDGWLSRELAQAMIDAFNLRGA